MSLSTSRWYAAGPATSQTRNMHASHANIHHAMQSEPTLHSTPLGGELALSWFCSPRPSDSLASFPAASPLFRLLQEPTTPGSGVFPVLTPDQSLFTVHSDCSTGNFRGAQGSLSPDGTGLTSDPDRRRAFSETIQTQWTPRSSETRGSPEIAVNGSSGIGDGTEENLGLLRGIDVGSRPNCYRSDVPYVEEHIEDVGAYANAYLQPEIGRIQTLSNYTSDQSKQEAKPWSELALQHHEIQVLPESLRDEDLSFALEQRLTNTEEHLPARHLSAEITESANLLAARLDGHSLHKQQKRNRQKLGGTDCKNTSKGNQNLLSASKRTAVSPATSTASTNSTINRGRRRQGYRLPEQNRINAKEVRDQGACLRCSIMKEKCTAGEPPCENCKRVAENSKFRLWKSPCTFKRLGERSMYLLPASLTSQIAVSQVRAFLNQHITFNLRKFLLRLYIGFGEPWTFWAIEIVPESPNLLQMFGFHGYSAAGAHECALVQLSNPPVVPLWVDPLLMRVNIDCWLDRMVGDPQAGWQRRWFPDLSQIWQLEILAHICQLCQVYEPTCDGVAETAKQTLRWALKLAVLNYVMGHAFLVPESDAEFLFRQLENPLFRGQRPQGKICSRAANKFVKMMVLPMLRLAIEETLNGLQQLIRASEPRALLWDYEFAIVFVCLMVAGSTQRSLFQRAAVCATKSESSYSRSDAVSDADTIDSELVVHLIGTFHDKFHTGSKRKGINPFGNGSSGEQRILSNFAAHVRTATERHYRIPFDDSQSNLGAERLLARFMRPFFQKVCRV